MGNDSQTTNRHIFSQFGNAILIIAVFLYFIGWTYAYYLMDHFGISIISAEIPFYYIFVYSFTVVTCFYSMILVLGIILIFLFIPSRFFKFWILCLILFSLFFLMFYISKYKANEEATLKRMGYAKTVIFYFKGNKKSFYPIDFMEINKSGKLKLLIQTKDKYFVFYQPEGNGHEMPYGFTFVIPIDEVLIAEIGVQNISIEGK